jgi:hypothetical protein
MSPLPIAVLAGLFGATLLFAIVLDTLKIVLFHHLRIA